MMRNIDEFGSMENVRDRAAPWGEILQLSELSEG